MKLARRYWIYVCAALLVTLIVAFGALRRVDKWVQDWLFQRPGPTTSDIVVIGIDEDALSRLGPYNTWDRNVMAAALEALAADPENLPAVTAVDVLYAGETAGETDRRLADAAKALGHVVTASMAEFGEAVTWEDGRAASVDTAAVIGYAQPFPALREISTQGHINAMCDRDGVMRHALLYVEPEPGQRVYSMAFETARSFLESRGQTLDPPDSKYLYVPFTGRPGAYYDGVSIAWLLEGKVPSGYWANKIVLIGPYAAALQDAFFTPIDKGRQMYGVEFQANVIQSFLERNHKSEISDLTQLAALFILCVLAMALFMRMRVSDGGVLCMGMILLSGVATTILYGMGWVTHPLWLPVGALVLYLLAMVAHYSFRSRSSRTSRSSRPPCRGLLFYYSRRRVR